MEQKLDYFARNSGKDPTDYQKRLHDAHTAARAERYDEALDGYIWFHENSVNEPRMVGVRLSFALSYWIELGRVYPPARAALEAIRDKKTRSLLNGIQDVPFFQDVTSINKYLGCERATYDLFVTLNSLSPLLAHRNYARLAIPAIVQCGDFELARQLVPSLENELQWHCRILQLDIERGRDRYFGIPMYVGHLRLILETLRGIGDMEQAEQVLASALKSLESPQVREAVQSALNAGK